MSSVLFVCMGNICRSPAAECVLRALADGEGVLDQIRIDSAGTTGYHSGDAPDQRMREAATRRGYRFEGAARKVTVEDFGKFDLVVAMDRDNLADLEVMQPANGRANLRLFSQYYGDHPADVPDPYYGGASGFDAVIDLMERGCPACLEELLGLP